MKIVFYNETLLSGGIEKCIELLSKYLSKNYEIEIVYIDDSILDMNIVNLLSKYAYVHKFKKDEKIFADICVWCRIYLDWENLRKQIIAKKYFLWVHSKPRALPNCILDNSKFIDSVEKIICVSECVKKEIAIPQKTIVIHNFVDPNIKLLANEYDDPFSNLSEDCLKLCITSRLSVEKGFARTEEIVKYLINNNINFTLKIVGKGRNYESIIKSNFSKYKQVEFIGYKENPYPFIKNSDYMLVLSNYETWGNVITEAKVLGVPSIVSNFPSACEQVEDNVNGILIPLDCNDFSLYLKNLKTKSIKFKETLNSFKYINEINKWEDLLKIN